MEEIIAEGAASVFSSGNTTGGAEDIERERARLHAKIGEQAVVLDFLAKKSKQLGL